VFIQFMPIWAQEVSKSPGAPAVVYGVVVILLMFVLPTGAAGLLHRAGTALGRGYHRLR
jgi:branched-chain amino acid transport system permease protein